MSRATTSDDDFYAIISSHKQLITKVCLMYARDRDHFNDLYQEVVMNMWTGMKTFQGRSKLSTWIYRTSINTCISYLRKHNRHDSDVMSLEDVVDIAANGVDKPSLLREMYALIGRLREMDRALILMWLDELSYDEIAAVSGLSRNNVASRLRRIKQTLVKSADS